MKKRNLNLGQIGLVIILLMVVILTVGLSVAGRQVTDVRLSKQEEETSRAFNLAEAGIEYTLETFDDLDFSAAVGGELQITSGIPGQATDFPDLSLDLRVRLLDEVETFVEGGETLDVDVSPSEGRTGTSLLVDWGKDQDCTNEVASLETTVYYGGSGGFPYRTRTYSWSGFHHDDDNFYETSVAGEVSYGNSPRTGYCRRITLTLDTEAITSGNDVLVVLRPIYNGTTIYVAAGGGTNLPDQYYQIRSVGASAVGEETRAIQVLRSRPRVDSIFHYAVYSGGALVK